MAEFDQLGQLDHATDCLQCAAGAAAGEPMEHNYEAPPEEVDYDPEHHAMYGWVITKDHLYPEAEEGVYSGPGVMGPWNIAPQVERKLGTPGQRFIFRMYDDDGELYYTGYGAVPDGVEPGDEDFAFGPLDDYGTPNAGAVTIKWQGHPEWDCG
jgi:hypothetical protein